MRITGPSAQTASLGHRLTFRVNLLSPVSDFTYAISVFIYFQTSQFYNVFQRIVDVWEIDAGENGRRV